MTYCTCRIYEYFWFICFNKKKKKKKNLQALFLENTATMHFPMNLSSFSFTFNFVYRLVNGQLTFTCYHIQTSRIWCAKFSRAISPSEYLIYKQVDWNIQDWNQDTHCVVSPCDNKMVISAMMCDGLLF